MGGVATECAAARCCWGTIGQLDGPPAGERDFDKGDAHRWVVPVPRGVGASSAASPARRDPQHQCLGASVWCTIRILVGAREAPGFLGLRSPFSVWGMQGGI